MIQPINVFWGRGDAAKVLHRECLGIIARKYGSAAVATKPAKPARKPSIRKLVEQAEKTGKTVTSVTTPDGSRLDFGEAGRATNFNPWDRVLPNASKIHS